MNCPSCHGCACHFKPASIDLDQWQKLANHLQQEPQILGYRNTAENLVELHQLGLTSLFTVGSAITAFVAFWPTDRPDFLEFGSIWVKPELRGQGLGRAVFVNLMQHQPLGKNVFLITKEPKVVHLVLSDGWQEATAESWEQYIPWDLSCGLCDIEGDRKSCPFKGQRNLCGLYYKLG